ELDILLRLKIFADGVFGIAGDEDDLLLTELFTQSARKRWPIHARHDDVGDKKIDRPAAPSHDLKRVLSAPCFQDLVSSCLERTCRKGAHSILIFDEKNCALAGEILHARREILMCRIRMALLGTFIAWQIDAEGRAVADLAFNGDLPTRLRDDA